MSNKRHTFKRIAADTEYNPMEPDDGSGESTRQDAGDDIIDAQDDAGASRPVDIDITQSYASDHSAFFVAIQPTFRPGNELPFVRAISEVRNEEVRKLRTELLLRHGHLNSSAMTLAIVSAMAGEGRSVLAAELAMSFAQLGRPTLLIDADLRSPSQHRLFNADVVDGVFQAVVYGGRPTLHAVENFPTLSVMAAGHKGSFNPTELLSSVRFQLMIDMFRQHFDFIVIDTPSFSTCSDAQIISAVVGNVLSVHRAAVSTYRDSQAMLRSLMVSNANVVGAVLNHF
jgi:receptor protein-tyrosine kinase